MRNDPCGHGLSNHPIRIESKLKDPSLRSRVDSFRRTVTRLVCWLPFMTKCPAANRYLNDFLKITRATLNPEY